MTFVAFSFKVLNNVTDTCKNSQYLQVSSFSSVIMKGNFSLYSFLNVLKFHWRQCDKCMIRRINHALLPTPKNNLKKGANGASVLMLYMFAASCFNNEMPTLGRFGQNTFCFMSFLYKQRASNNKSAYYYFGLLCITSISGFSKVWHKKLH